MKQILQSLQDGTTQVLEVPTPRVSATTLVVQTRASIVSPGTERMLVDFGRSSLLDKARQQPDKVRQVLQKVKTDGLAPTYEAVRAKLDEPIPLGYCQAGVVIGVGRDVPRFQVGDRVVSNGPHAEQVRVPWTLAARIPDSVSFEAAAFTPLAAIALQGLRLAAPTLGETFVVYGLGAIGLLAVQLVRAAGCRVIGIDRAPERVARARACGAEVLDGVADADLPAAVRALTGGAGADAVLLTLATTSAEPVHLAADMSRKRGRLVLVGVADLHLRREDFYRKELSFQVSCSYGAGRYDPAHEDAGVDYPLPFVRWTEARNFAAVLDLMADGRLDPLPLITHRVPFEDAPRAYDVLTSDASALGVALVYQEPSAVAPAAAFVPATGAAAAGAGVIGCIGAGNFASRMLAPALKAAGAQLHTIVSSGGTAAALVARRQGFTNAGSDAQAVINDPAIDTVVVATRHDSHARFVVQALEAGKHVFVEKPLALTNEDVDAVEQAWRTSGRVLCVGFNRRYAPLVVQASAAVRGRTGPLVVGITVNAGALPPDHWTKHPQVGGGRVAGEGCHFIDLARHLVGSPIVDLSVTNARDREGHPVEDIALLHLHFADGSAASIQYLSNASSAFPKERVELFWDGKTIVIDNFRRGHGYGVTFGSRWGGRQDKGHRALVQAFMTAVREGGAPPIPADELFEVSRWTVRAGRHAWGRAAE